MVLQLKRNGIIPSFGKNLEEGERKACPDSKNQDCLKVFKFSLFARIRYFLLIGMLFFIGSPSVVSAFFPPSPTPLNGPASGPLRVGIDDNQHVMVFYENSGFMQTYYFSNNVWYNLPIDSVDSVNYDLAMDPSGPALAIMMDFNSLTAKGAYFDKQMWTVSDADPTGTITGLDVASVAMNGPSQGLAVWTDAVTNVLASFFSNGTWSPVTIIGTGFQAKVAYSTNGTAVAAWEDPSGQIVASNYNGTLWSPVPTVLVTPVGILAQVGIDAAGKAIVLSQDNSGSSTQGAILANFFDGTNWTLSQTLSPLLPNNVAPGEYSLAMAPGGTAVATWQYSDTSLNIYHLYYSQFDGTSWSPAVDFEPQSPPPVANGPTAITLDSNGNGILAYSFDGTTLLGADLPVGGSLINQQTLATGDNIAGVGVLDSNGFSAFVWTSGDDPDVFAIADVIPGPSPGIQAKSCKDRFASQTDRVNTITWQRSTDPNVVAYKLSRNGVVIATIPADGPYKYKDHDVCKSNNLYSVVAVDFDGVFSEPVAIRIN